MSVPRANLVAVGAAVAVSLTSLTLHTAFATEFLVSSAAQISTAMQTAEPGDVLIMSNGTWTNQNISFAGNGSSASPITLRAQSPGQVHLNGSSKLTINGDWLIVEGLRFESGSLTSNNNKVVSFTSSSQNSRFTNSAIIDWNPPVGGSETDLVGMNGQYNRVDHNYFNGHNHVGQTIEASHSSGIPNYHRIDSNYFADRLPGSGNGWETIRIGLSGVAQSSSYSVVENNLFERVNGENEVISNKSSHNTIRYNTFRDVGATLTLRHGNDATVEGNFFLGENNPSSGGIRVIGERHKIINNYFANIDDNGGGAIAINRGQLDAEATGYQHVKDAVIAHNTFVNTLGTMLRFDAGASDRPLLAENLTVANNLFRSSGPSIFTGAEGAGWTWQGNIAFGGSLGPKAGAAGIANVDPQLQLGSDGLWRPGPTSPAIDGSSGNFSSLLTTDMDGQPRIGIFDVGADEASTATIVRRPLVVGDVGPSWLFDLPSPASKGCGTNGCAVQAEDFTAVLDPNGNGLTWTVLNQAGALNGKVISAPAGTRTDVPGQTQDAVAVYEMVFETPGMYTAYYRARGPNSAANSIYSPDGFGTDPDNLQTLTDDGTFSWIRDTQSFAIDSSNIDVPLELRLGRREGLSQIDAIVLSLDGFMNAAELDAIFTRLSGDYNGDGRVDAADYVQWRSTLGMTVTKLSGADGDGSGLIDEGDFALWRANFGTTPAATGTSSSVIPEPAPILLMSIALLFVGSCRFDGRRLRTSRHARSAPFRT